MGTKPGKGPSEKDTGKSKIEPPMSVCLLWSIRLLKFGHARCSIGGFESLGWIQTSKEQNRKTFREEAAAAATSHCSVSAAHLLQAASLASVLQDAS